MVRGKTQMKRIENASSRQVTFSKRRNGLLKKAYELSVLCDAEVGLVIFSATGRLSEFASPSMQKMLEKYQKYSEESGTSNTTNQQDTQYMKQEITNMEERISILESSQRNMVGDSLESCSMKELTKLESQVEKGLSHIRAWKTKLLVDRIEFLERKLCDSQYVDDRVLTTPLIGLGSMQHSEVETQLVMRPPDIHDCLPMHNSI